MVDVIVVLAVVVDVIFISIFMVVDIDVYFDCVIIIKFNLEILSLSSNDMRDRLLQLITIHFKCF